MPGATRGWTRPDGRSVLSVLQQRTDGPVTWLGHGKISLHGLGPHAQFGQEAADLAARSITRHVLYAALSQLNSAARRRPRRRSVVCSSVSPHRRSSASVQASTSAGSTSSPASPTTSGKDDALDTATGVPQAIASSGVRPKPSYQAGWARQVARL